MNTKNKNYGSRIACHACGRTVRIVNGTVPLHYDEWGDPCANEGPIQ